MPTVPSRARVDERVMGAGTTVRFALLIVMLVVASGSMIVGAITLFGSSNGCLLAAGGVPDQSAAVNVHLIELQRDAFNACMARYAPSPPWWVAAVWPVAVVLAAGVLFFGLSAWKARRRRVVPLEVIDHGGALRRELNDLAATAGLTQPPRFVVNPAAASTGAVVFGRTRRPVVCLHGGLLVRRRTDLGGFRTVLLHELAHIRNGDVTITYVTVALWRVFLALVLLPYVGLHFAALVDWLRAPIWMSSATSITQGLALTGVMGALVYLARSDVLRSREIHADLAALRWGADPHGWSVASPGRVGGIRGAFGSFVELWRTHPRWDLRRHALSDPAALFGVQALPMVLTGISASLINAQVQGYLREFAVGGDWVAQALQAVTAGLVTSVAGIALWRAVAYAVLTSRPVPSGVRAGLWLGCGMAVGELAMNQVAAVHWLPGHPEVLLVVVVAGAVFGWWIVQCAQLWVRAWQGRTLRLAMLIGLAPAWLTLSAWFAWWQAHGISHAIVGWLDYDLAAARTYLTHTLPGPVAEHSTTFSALVQALPVISELETLSLLSLAVATVWAVPLLAWAVRPVTTAPRWARAALQDSRLDVPLDGGQPPLRRVLLPGLLGGVTCWVAVAGAQEYVRSWGSPAPHQGAFHLSIYQAWLFVAIAVPTVLTAGIAAALASRYRLLLALIAAETAVVVGFVGMGVLVSVDGCIQPRTGLWTFCAWHTEWADIVLDLLIPSLVTGVFAAIVAAFITSAIRMVRKRPERPPVMAFPDPIGMRPGLALRRACVSVLGIAATATAINRRAYEAFRRLIAAQTKAAKDPTGDAAPFLPICADLSRIARDADTALSIPDPGTQVLWRKFITKLTAASKDCIQAVQSLERTRQKRDYASLNKSLDELEAAAVAEKSALSRMVTVARAAERARK